MNITLFLEQAHGVSVKANYITTSVHSSAESNMGSQVLWVCVWVCGCVCVGVCGCVCVCGWWCGEALTDHRH